MKYLLKSITASVAAGKPMYYHDALTPYIDDPEHAFQFCQEHADRAQKESGGWLEAVPFSKALAEKKQETESA